MKRATLLVLIGTVAFLAGCEVPANNTPANRANANAAKAIPVVPTADTLIALDRQATDAYFKGDAKFFEGMLNDKFVMLGPNGSRLDKDAAIKMIGGVKCDLKEGWKLDEPNMSAIDADTYILNYKGTFDGTCTVRGMMKRVPSSVRAATVWIRSGDKWLAAFHGENAIVDLNAPASPLNLVEAKKEAPGMDNRTASQLSPADRTTDPATEALVAIERSVWEAWKATDRTKIEEITNKDLSFVDIFGNVTSNRADTIKLWTEHKCDVKTVSVTDGVQRSLSPTVSILTFKGNAEGSCYGQKMTGPIYGTSLYVKNVDAWKLAFTMNSLGD